MRYSTDPEKVVKQLVDDYDAWSLRWRKNENDPFDDPSFIKNNYGMTYRVNEYGDYASVAILLQEHPIVYIDTMDSTVNVCDSTVCTSAVLPWDVWDWTNCCGGE